MKKMDRDNKKMNLCLVAPLPPPYGGIANWTAMMQKFMTEKCADLISFSIVDTSPKRRVTEGRGLLERVFGGGISMLKNIKEVRKIIKADKPDCIHITSSGSLSLIRDYVILGLAKRKKVGTIYHIRYGRIPILLNGKSIEAVVLKWCLKKADRIIAIDKKTCEAIIKAGYEAIMIPNPINLELIPEANKERNNYVSFSGWVVKNKGIEELLEAWSNLVKDGTIQEWRLRIIGPYKEEYVSSLKDRFDCSNIDFMNERKHEETLDIVNEGKIFVLPSYTEGFPNSVLEAMALGEYVIGSSVGAIPEMLSDGCGVIVEPANTKQLEKALFDAIGTMDSDGDEINIYGNNALNKTQKEYNIGVVFNRYMEEWKRVIR